MIKDEYDEMLERLLKTKTIQDMYDEFIIKDITFKEWVVGNLDELLSKQLYKE